MSLIFIMWIIRPGKMAYLYSNEAQVTVSRCMLPWWVSTVRTAAFLSASSCFLRTSSSFFRFASISDLLKEKIKHGLKHVSGNNDIHQIRTHVKVWHHSFNPQQLTVSSVLPLLDVSSPRLLSSPSHAPSLPVRWNKNKKLSFFQNSPFNSYHTEWISHTMYHKWKLIWRFEFQ